MVLEADCTVCGDDAGGRGVVGVVPVDKGRVIVGNSARIGVGEGGDRAAEVGALRYIRDTDIHEKSHLWLKL